MIEETETFPGTWPRSPRGLFRRRPWALAALLLAWSVAWPARAELDHQGGGWLVTSGSGSLESVSPRLSRLRWWFDFQARFFDSTDGLGQTVVRPGLGWSVTENTSVWLGYAWIRNYPPNRSHIDENRIWQQFLWNGTFGRWSFQSRTRLEQRFVQTGSDVGWRIRQFVKVLYPLLDSDRLRFAASEEIFIEFNSTDWGADAGIDQNRLFLGFNVPLNAAPRIQAEFGYLNQYLAPSSRRRQMNHLGVVSLLFRF